MRELLYRTIERRTLSVFVKWNIANEESRPLHSGKAMLFLACR
ncbi:hypothetical protein ACVWVZ_000132 [Pseudomonas tolaasii]